MARLHAPRYAFAALLGFGAMCTATIALVGPVEPAAAQLSVFDPANYSQNVLTAARTLQQVNNQIKLLQNQAQSLINQAKNLSTIGFPELDAMSGTLQQIDQLMGRAQGLQFSVATLTQDYKKLYPQSFGQALTSDQYVTQARARMAAATAAFEHTMTVQAQVAENVHADAAALAAIAARSQGAEGALQATQATNQLLALTAKQQFQIETVMAAQYRAQAIEQASRAQAAADAQAATAKFLGTGRAYPPH